MTERTAQIATHWGESADFGEDLSADSEEDLFADSEEDLSADSRRFTQIFRKRIVRISSTGLFVAKVSSQGIFQWAISVSGSNDSYGYGIAVDSFGNLYMTGFFSGTAAFGTTTLTSQGGMSDVFVAKLRY